MVIAKIVLVLVFLIGGLAVAQQQHVFERVGVVGGCDLVRSPFGESGGVQWWSCHEGVLTGYPSLTRENCVVREASATRQVWRCPNPINRPSAL